MLVLLLLLVVNSSGAGPGVGVEGGLLGLLPVLVFVGGFEGHLLDVPILVGEGVIGGSSPSSRGLIGGVLMTPSIQSSARNLRSSSSISSVLLKECPRIGEGSNRLRLASGAQ